jgi:sugar O-acyltransferase (sialic acid O-acetyltransferase NeuD family)
MSEQGCVIYSAGGFGREAAWLARACADLGRLSAPVAFIEDDPSLQGKRINGLPVISFEDCRKSMPKSQIICAVGNPSTRERLVRKCADAGFSFASAIHPSVIKSDEISCGMGTLICAGSILTVNITLGQHVHVNLDCTIGHDVVLEDYATLAPGVHVSGWVRIGRGAYIGTGANIVNGTHEKPLLIGAGAVIGAGACVIGDVPAGATYVGVPARST